MLAALLANRQCKTGFSLLNPSNADSLEMQKALATG
jgi:hypothetical protein